MENLKLTSIRVSVCTIDRAHALAKQLTYYNPSDILRVAMWVGLKVLSPGSISALNRKMWVEEAGDDIITLEDVLRTAGVLDKLKSGAGV